MKTCPKCGAYVDDKEISCPECGSAVAMKVSGLSLKQDDDSNKRKSGNPMGQTMSTGSGLTDILRADAPDDADDFYEGSIPTSLSKNVIDYDYSTKKSKLLPNLFKLVLLALVIYGVYFVVTNVIKKSDSKPTEDDMVDKYVEAFNSNDLDIILDAIPPYEEAEDEEISNFILAIQGKTITSYEIASKKFYDDKQLTALQDEIKMESAKTSNLKKACKVEITCQISKNNALMNSTITLELVNVRDNWYINFLSHENLNRFLYTK